MPDHHYYCQRCMESFPTPELAERHVLETGHPREGIKTMPAQKPVPYRPISESQWAIFRARLIRIEAGHERWRPSPAELVEMFLLLMDRLDQIERKVG
jgi:hypothetical protein